MKKLKIIKKLKEVNLKLWDIENAKRESEKIKILVKNLLNYHAVFINIMT